MKFWNPFLISESLIVLIVSSCTFNFSREERINFRFHRITRIRLYILIRDQFLEDLSYVVERGRNNWIYTFVDASAEPSVYLIVYFGRTLKPSYLLNYIVLLSIIPTRNVCCTSRDKCRGLQSRVVRMQFLLLTRYTHSYAFSPRVITRVIVAGYRNYLLLREKSCLLSYFWRNVRTTHVRE